MKVIDNFVYCLLLFHKIPHIRALLQNTFSFPNIHKIIQEIMRRLLQNLTILIVVSLLLPVACSKDKEEKELSPEEAKIELRAASQEITLTTTNVMEMPAVSTMMFLMLLTDFDDFDIEFKSMLSDPGNYRLPEISQLLRDNELPLKKLQNKSFLEDPQNTGIYTFNFQTEEFDLTSTNVNYLQVIFPANETAFDQENNNAALTISNMEFETVTYSDGWDTWEEEVPTRMDILLVIDSDEVLTCEYTAAFNSEGTPTSMSVNIGMAPYEFTMTLAGSGVNYNSTIMFTGNNAVIFNSSLDLKYNSGSDEIDHISGFIHFPPLRFDGSVNIAMIEECDENIACLNQYIDVRVKHTKLNMVLGHLEFRVYDDPYWEEEYAMPVIVYQDDSWEFLHEIFELFADAKK